MHELWYSSGGMNEKVLEALKPPGYKKAYSIMYGSHPPLPRPQNTHTDKTHTWGVKQSSF
jgi:hypothetical protein